MSDPNFAPSPAQLALMTHLQATLERRQQEIAEVASNASSTRQSPDGEASSQGLVRTRDEMELQSSTTLLSLFSRLHDRTIHYAEAFMKEGHPMRHAYQTLIATLECRDKLALIWADHSAIRDGNPFYSQRTLHDWSYAAILSATITSYRDQEGVPSIATNIMNVTRETGRCEAVKAIIISGLTQVRCHIKACVFKALKEHAPGARPMTRALWTSPPSPDLALVMPQPSPPPVCTSASRLSFVISSSILDFTDLMVPATLCPGVQSDEHSEAKFWKEVDSKLATYRKVAVTKEALQILYNANYEDDKKLYGPPDAAIPTATMHDMEDWLATLQEAM
ncbi:hypothetical protein FB451DRAFT_1445537 [Mycena latifolia]|nr:hypothetical protein FB451DRAFT_1445537 [Mycena latifolia]